MSVARVPVLMYHRVGVVQDRREARYAISPENFAAHMRALAHAHFQAISMEDFLAWLETGRALPDGAFLLTFDDGFQGVGEHALPVLERLNWPFTVFLVSDLIGTTDAWVTAAEPGRMSYPLLNTQEIHDMQRRGASFHSHARNHPRLPALNDLDLADQLAGSRAAITELLGREVNCLAYPFGLHDDRVRAATCAAGYRAAFSTESGFNARTVNRYRIRRLDVYGTDTPAMLLRKIRLGSNDGRLTTLIRYYLRNIVSLIAEKS